MLSAYRPLGFFLLGAWSLVVARPAEAAESTVPETRDGLAYAAADRGCPLESAYRAEARRRMPERTDRTRTLRVRLAPAGSGFEGTVEAIELLDGKPRVVASRTVAGATCDEVADATLLLVALGLLEAREAPPPPAPPPVRAPVPHDGTPSPASVRPTFHVAALALAATGVGPLAIGGGARIGVGLDRPGPVRPEIRAGLDVIGDAELRNALGTASRSMLAGRLDLCPVGIGSAVVLRFCGAGAIGEVRVRGEDVASPRSEGRLYAAAGGSVRGQARLASGLGVELSAGVLGPLRPHRFYFEPDTTLFRLDRPVLFVEGGLSWSIP